MRQQQPEAVVRRRPVDLPDRVEPWQVRGPSDADPFLCRLRPGATLLDRGVVLEGKLNRIIQRQQATGSLGRRIGSAENATGKCEPDPPHMTTH